jgi:hypothetical protein
MSFIRNHLHLTTENGGENQKQELSHKVIFLYLITSYSPKHEKRIQKKPEECYLLIQREEL